MDSPTGATIQSITIGDVEYDSMGGLMIDDDDHSDSRISPLLGTMLPSDSMTRIGTICSLDMICTIRYYTTLYLFCVVLFLKLYTFLSFCCCVVSFIGDFCDLYSTPTPFALYLSIDWSNSWLQAIEIDEV